MKTSLIRSIHDDAIRVVLILQSDRAYWFKVMGQQVVDCYNQPLLDECQQEEVSCPWINCMGLQEPFLVELVLDTTLDEVDRVSVAQSQYALVNRYRKLMTLARLRRDYQQADITLLEARDHDNVAALMHPAISEQWASWLLRLQSLNVVFHRVVAGSELASHWSRSLCERMLVVMRVADYERHIFVDYGHMLFLRTVHVDGLNDTPLEEGVESVSPSIEQSIEYVGAVVGIDVDVIAVVKPNSNDNVVAGINQEQSDTSFAEQVFVLLNMLLELPVETDVTFRAAGAERYAKSLSDRKQRVIGRVGFFHSSVRRCMPNISRQYTDRWSLRCSATRWFDALEPSLRYVITLHRIAWLSIVSAVLSILAIFGVSMALLYGVENNREMHQFEVHQAMIKRAESDAYSAATAVFPAPKIAADSLFISDELSGSALLAPAELLEELATVVTAVAGIQLDQLVWMLVEPDELFESLTHSLGSVPHRQTIDVDAHNVVLQLELSGRVSGETLKNQQTLLKRFVKDLWKIKEVLTVHILESPVDTALSSASDMNRLGPYRVSLTLGGL